MLEKGLVQENVAPKNGFSLARCRKGKYTLSIVFEHFNAGKAIGVSLLQS